MNAERATYKNQQPPVPTAPCSSAVCDSLNLPLLTMQTHYLCFLLLSLLYCSNTLALSSSNTDSERTLSIPSSPIRHLTPQYLQDTATSSPDPTSFVRFNKIGERPAHRSGTTSRVRSAQKTLQKDLNSLSAQLERSAPYLGKTLRAHGKSAVNKSPSPDKEALRQNAVNVYLRKKHLRKQFAEARTAAGLPTSPRKSAFPPLSAFKGHPILGPQAYRARKNRKGESRSAADSDRDWMPGAKQKGKPKGKGKAKPKSESESESESKGESESEGKVKATYKEKRKAKAVSGGERRPKMRKLLHLG